MFGGAPQPEALVTIKMGKCAIEPQGEKFLITPEKHRGEVRVVKVEDIPHFQWRSRETLDVDPQMDHMVFPGDAEFTKVDTKSGKDDRVYLLQFKAQESRRFFFWMQNKDASDDDELVEKLQQALAGTADGESALGAMLRGLQQQAPQQAPAAADGGAPGLSLENLQDVFSNLNMPPAAGGALSSEALARAMAGAMAGAGAPRLTLGAVASGDALDASGVLDDAATVERLLAHLPESQRNAEELRTLIRAPQFRQALGQLTSALLTPDNYASILANFGISAEDAPFSADPVASFLGAILKSSGPAEPADAEAKDGDVDMADAK